jgi:hypothetical protein
VLRSWSLAAGVVLLAAALVAAPAAQTPAAATTNTHCDGLQLISVHGLYETWGNLCVNKADDGQSLRAYLGLECRYNSVRHTVCRWDINSLALVRNGAGVRNDNLGVYPASGWSAGSSFYGTWYNPAGWCWPAADGWYSLETNLDVRYADGFLDTDTWPRQSIGGTITCP